MEVQHGGGTADLYRHHRADVRWLVRRLLGTARRRVGHSAGLFADVINHRLPPDAAVTGEMLYEWEEGQGQPPADVFAAALVVAEADMQGSSSR